MEANKEQFTSIPHSLMANEHLTDQDKLTLGLILSFIKNDKECFMGNEYIAERMGISKNAASIRVKRLEKLGCISLRYTYKEGTNMVDKRYITLLSLTPKVSSTKRDVSSDRREGIVHETKGYRPTDEGVSSKLGGIIQPYYTSVLDNVVDKSLDKVLNKENSVELTNFEREQLLLVLDNITAPDRVLSLVRTLITDGAGYLTSKNKELVLQHKNQFKGKLLQQVIQQLE
jgi:DNA-binding MarR family transcriptional regulator